MCVMYGASCSIQSTCSERSPSVLHLPCFLLTALLCLSPARSPRRASSLVRFRQPRQLAAQRARFPAYSISLASCGELDASASPTAYPNLPMMRTQRTASEPIMLLPECAGAAAAGAALLFGSG
jgi:hypothetical protein